MKTVPTVSHYFLQFAAHRCSSRSQWLAMFGPLALCFHLASLVYSLTLETCFLAVLAFVYTPARLGVVPHDSHPC